jgi:hypothetical protein
MEDNPDKPILQKSCLSELHQSKMLVGSVSNKVLNLTKKCTVVIVR